MKRIFSVLFLLCIVASVLNAQVVLPDILSDNMVLQQNKSVKLWGKANLNAEVRVRVSWNNENYTTKSDKEGNWEVTVLTPDATFAPQTIIFSSNGDEVKLTNILIGEVWLASGQSNMEMPLNGFWNNPILKGNETILNSGNHKEIRFATIKKEGSYAPKTTCTGKWKIASPENSQWFSATAHYFACTLSDVLHVPIGIISSSWGGSRVESWTNRELLETYSDIDLKKEVIEKQGDGWRPLLMYNAMIYPLIKYNIAGFIWYQGESNVGKSDVYAERLANMVKLWRGDWGLGELPFYFVELAPYVYGDGENGVAGALLRESQFKAQTIIPNSEMISTNDLVEEYEKNNVHPKNKIDVGKRLAHCALAQTYGVKGISAHGPEYKSMKKDGDKIIISFNFAENGFNRLEGIEGFEIAGEDKKFYSAKAIVNTDDRTIIVQSDKVLNPVAVRYCFRNYQVGNLKNTRELPVVPFRTDNFDK